MARDDSLHFQSSAIFLLFVKFWLMGVTVTERYETIVGGGMKAFESSRILIGACVRIQELADIKSPGESECLGCKSR